MNIKKKILEKFDENELNISTYDSYSEYERANEENTIYTMEPEFESKYVDPLPTTPSPVSPPTPSDASGISNNFLLILILIGLYLVFYKK